MFQSCEDRVRLVKVCLLRNQKSESKELQKNVKLRRRTIEAHADKTRVAAMIWNP